MPRPYPQPWNPATERHAIAEAEAERSLADHHWENLDIAVGYIRKLLSHELQIQPDQLKNPALYPKLVERGWHEPKITLLGDDDARAWLTERGLFNPELHIVAPERLLIFNFPPPVAHFWWKQANELDLDGKYDRLREHEIDPYRLAKREDWLPRSPKDIRLGGGLEEWGRMYSNTIGSVWHLRDTADGWGTTTNPAIKQIRELLGGYGGWGIRLNAIGEHDAQHYYYVWGWYAPNTKPPVDSPDSADNEY